MSVNVYTQSSSNVNNRLLLLQKLTNLVHHTSVSATDGVVVFNRTRNTSRCWSAVMTNSCMLFLR